MNSEAVRDISKRVEPSPIPETAPVSDLPAACDLDGLSAAARIDLFVEKIFNPPQKETPR
jgi:hypothetical protein